MSIAKKLLTAFLLLLLFPILFLLYALFVNWNDEQPSALAIQYEQAYRNRPKVSAEENAYIYMMGFAAPDPEEPFALGLKRMALFESVINGQPGDVDGSPLIVNYDYRKECDDGVMDDVRDKCRDSEGGECLDTLEKHKDQLATALGSETWLLKRYFGLLQYPQYQEALPFDVNLPLQNYSALLDGQRVFLVQLWLQAADGKAPIIKSLLDQDATLWRKVLASSDELITKMIAVAALKRNFSMGTLVLRRLSAVTNENGMPDVWNEPFSKNELGLTQVLQGEWLFQRRLLQNTKNLMRYQDGKGYVKGVTDISDYFTVPFLQPQASANLQAEAFAQVLTAFDVPLDQYSVAAKQVSDAAKGKQEWRVYNFIGSLLSAIASPLYNSYFMRTADLEGARQAALLTNQLRHQKLPKDAIGEAIKTSPLRNPYTGEAFTWDASAAAVQFQGLGDRGLFTFYY